MMKDDLSKSELFELSGEYSSGNSNLDELNSLEFSNLDLDDDLEAFKSKKQNDQKQKLEFLHLQKELQIVKLELSQKDRLLNELKLEYVNKCESLEERNHQLLHQNQILSARLNEIVAIHQEEDKRKQDQIRLELSRILVRQQELEQNNERFMKNEMEIKKEIRNIDVLHLSDEEFEYMMRKDEDLLSIREFATLKLNQTVRPLKAKLEEAYRKISSLEEELKSEKTELNKIRHVYDEDKRSYNVNSIDNQKLYYELADVKAQLQQANFKKDNYDRIKYEREEYERKYTDSETKLSKHEATIQVLTTERDNLLRDVNQLKQEISLLRHDKDYLQKQFVDTQSRLKVTEDKLEQTQQFYEDAKKSKEELYENYMKARDSYKKEYDSKLSIELEDLKLKTNQEIEKLRNNTKEFYEREIKSLKESKDLLQQEKEKHELNEKEMNLKYQEAVNELRLIQISCENKVSELKSELKLKSFELERTHMINEEGVNNYKKALIENEKMNKKLEIIQNEYYSLQMKNDKRFLELESELNEKKARLEGYEKCENEMDMVIRQVAETSGEIDETEAEKLLLSYGYGSNMMLNAKRRIQQNVHLTKRMLNLEQINTSLRLELNRERSNYKELQDQLDVAKNVIENTKQPHEFLVRSIQAKETQIKKQQASMDMMLKKIDELSTERELLVRKQNEMTADIERLIRNNEELFYIRDEIKKNGLLLHNKRILKPSNSNNNISKQNQIMSMENLNDDQPKPLFFTKTTATSRSSSPKQRYKLRKSPDHLPKNVYTIDQS